MQMHSVDTSAGTAICWAPSRMAWMTGLPMSRLRLMFSTSTVASSTRMPTASASPPSVMMLMVSPSRLRVMTDARIESGMDTAMMRVLRQLPRKSRIIMAVRQAAITASRITPLTAARTKMDWSASGWTWTCGGRVAITRARRARIPADPDLALLAAVRVRDRGARDGHELGPQEVEADVVELRLGESRQGELENGHRRRAVVDDQGRLDAGRELAQDGLRHRRHLRVGGVEVRIRLQEDLDHRLAVHRRRFDVLDVVDGRRQDSLVLCRDPSFHLFRIEAGELPGHRDHRDVDAREYVGGRAEEDHRARDEDEQGEHDKGVGTVESDPDDPHRSAMASDQGVPLHRLQTAESAGRLQQPERAAVTHERGHAPGWRHEAGTGTHASGQLPTLG